MASLAKLVAQIGDIALHARSGAEFRLETLRSLTEEVGAEGGVICSDARVGQDMCDGHHLMGGEALENRFSSSHLHDFQPDIPRLIRLSAWRDRDALSQHRRETASLYREYLPRVGLLTFAARCWSDDQGFHVITLAPHGAVDHRRFFRRATATLNAAFHIVALGERLHRPCSADVAGGSSDRAPQRPRLSPGENKVIALVERGLTNSEIASVLSLSPNTVRNRLAMIFRKLEVSRRSELVYQLHAARDFPDRHG